MLTCFLSFAFTKMQQSLELNYSACLKMCGFRDSCVKCLCSGFCLHFISSFSKFFFSMTSTWRRAFVWLKSDVNPTYLGQLHPCAQILNPRRCRCEVWMVHFRKSCLYAGIDSVSVTAPCPTPQVVPGSQNTVLLNVINTICIQLVVTKKTPPKSPWKSSGPFIPPLIALRIAQKKPSFVRPDTSCTELSTRCCT